MSYTALPPTPLDLVIDEFRVISELPSNELNKILRETTSALYERDNLFEFLFVKLKYDKDQHNFVFEPRSDAEIEEITDRYRKILCEDLHIQGLPEKIFKPTVTTNYRGSTCEINLEVLKSLNLLRYPYYQYVGDSVQSVVMYPGIKMDDLSLQLPVKCNGKLKLITVSGKSGILLIEFLTSCVKEYIKTVNMTDEFILALDFQTCNFSDVWAQLYGADKRARYVNRVNLIQSIYVHNRFLVVRYHYHLTVVVVPLNAMCYYLVFTGTSTACTGQTELTIVLASTNSG